VVVSESLAHWLRTLRAPAVSVGRWRRLPGALLAWRDAVPFVRLHYLAVAVDLGLLEELRRAPATAEELGVRLAIGNRALLDAFLALGESLGELRCRAGRWSLRGRRSSALAAPEADTMRAMVQEAIGYDAAVYAGLAAHLRGAPPGGYLQATGAVIARASRLVEPVLAPLLRSLVAKRHPRRVLDVGCGTGVYLVHAATAGGLQLTGLGVDLDAAVVELARQRLASAGLAARFEVRHADVRAVELPAAPWTWCCCSRTSTTSPRRNAPACCAASTGCWPRAARCCWRRCSRAARWPPPTMTCCFGPPRGAPRCPTASSSTTSCTTLVSPRRGGCSWSRSGRSTRSSRSAEASPASTSHQLTGRGAQARLQ
jgi:Methyltransferase domain